MTTAIYILLIIVLIIFIPVLVAVGMMLLPIAVECYVEAVETIEEFKRKRGKRK